MDPAAPNSYPPPEPDPGPAEPHVRRMRTQEEFEFAPDPQLVTDRQGVILTANHAAATLLRCPKEFLAGKPLGLFLAQGYRHRFYDSLFRLGHGGTTDQFETRANRRGGDPVDVAVRAAADRPDDTGTPTLRWLLRDVTELRRAEAARDALLRRVVTAQEDERRRVSREMHDTFGQLLTALSLAVKMARSTTALPPATADRLAEVQRVADDLSRAAHDLAVRLRPTALDDVGLYAALGQYVARWSARSGVEVDYEATAVETDRLPIEVETAIYRVVQEALTNVARHARARRVSVVVGRHGGHATLAVEDDGTGFDPAAAMTGRLGLVGMRERAALAGGTLDIESSPGGGTTVLARFTLRSTGGAREMIWREENSV